MENSDRSDRLRVYATQLFAMAIKAQERGEMSHADQLTMRAANYLDRATAVETSMTQQLQSMKE